jgi:hypothetical protein
MRISDVNMQNSQYFMNLLGLKNTKGSNMTQKGSSAANQMVGPFDLATLQRMAANDPTIKNVSIVDGKPHYEADHSKHVNSFGLTGMVITEDTKFETVPISEDIKNRLIEAERNMFINNFGTSGYDFSEEEAVFKDALTSAAEKDRINVAWSMDRIMLNEGNRLHSLVREAIPGWQPGQAFDKDFVRDLLEGKSMDLTV